MSLISIEEITEEESNHREPNIELINSIEEIGLKNPIIVLESENGGSPYRLIHGSRRLAAAKLLGWTHINCIVK